MRMLQAVPIPRISKTLGELVENSCDFQCVLVGGAVLVNRRFQISDFRSSMIEQKFAAIQQHPKNIGQCGLGIVFRTTLFQIFAKAFGFFGRWFARQAG